MVELPVFSDVRELVQHLVDVADVVGAEGVADAQVGGLELLAEAVLNLLDEGLDGRPLHPPVPFRTRNEKNNEKKRKEGEIHRHRGISHHSIANIHGA